MIEPTGTSAERTAKESASVPGSFVPPGLDEMDPGPALAAFLSAVEPLQLDGADRVLVLRAHQRMVSYHQANAYAAMTAIRDAYADLRHSEGREPNGTFDAEDAAAEIRAALHLTRKSADIELTLALNLAERLPEVLARLRDGSIDVRRARLIDNQTMDLPEDTARTLAKRILPRAASLTTGQIRSALMRLRMEVEPQEAALRYDRAREERRVVVEPTPEGTAHLHAMHLPPHKAQSIMRSLTGAAQGLRRDGETRSIDQLRSDVFVDALTDRSSTSAAPTRLTTGPSDSAGPSTDDPRSGRADQRGTIHLHVDLDTLTALTEHPGELDGYGPVIADVARQVAAENPESDWRFTVVDPGTGAHVSGTTRRRPTAARRRFVTAENPTCVFPGCRMPASECDLDHIVAWEHGGRTEQANLAPLCRHDHRIKHQAGWTYLKHGGGATSWVSPLGLRHETINTDPWRPRPPPDPPG